MAWVAHRYRRGRTVASLVVRDLGRGRPVRRRMLGRYPTVPDRSRFGVAVTRGAAVAWTTPAGPRDEHLRLAGPGRAARTLRTGRMRRLGIEDGTTLRWDGPRGTVYRDLVRRPVARGCPARTELFRAVANVGDVRVTQARYGTGYESHWVTRICHVGSGRDRVLGEVGEAWVEGNDLAVHAARWPWLLVTWASYDISQGCNWAFSEVVDGRTGRTVRSTPRRAIAGCTTQPVAAREAAISARGAPVWASLRYQPGVRLDRRLHTQRADGTLVSLDAGEIREVGIEGETATWTAGGVPRSAPLS